MTPPWQIVTIEGIGTSWAIDLILRKPHLRGSSSRDFEKVDQGKIIQSNLDMYCGSLCLYSTVMYLTYIFGSPKAYEGRKMNNLMWILMVGEVVPIIYSTDAIIWIMFHLVTARKRLSLK